MPKISSKNTYIEVETGDGSNLTGTITATGTAVVGTGTAFTTELIAGDVIETGGEKRIVVSIADATNLVIHKAFDNAVSGATANPVTYSKVVAAANFTGPQMQAAQVDVSDFDSVGFGDFIAGLIDAGSADFEIFYQPKVTSHANLIADFEAGTLLAWRVWLPDSAAGTVPDGADESNSRWSFLASVVTFSSEAATNDAWKASISARISGNPKLIVGVDP